MISGTKISQLPVITTLQNTDYLPVVRGNTTNRVSGLTITNTTLCAIKQEFSIDYIADTFVLTGSNINFTANNFNLSGTQVIEASSAFPALRITQTGTGNALVVEDSANPDSTPFIINSSGQIVVGATTTDKQGISLISQTGVNPNNDIHLQSVGGTTSTNGSKIHFLRARNTLVSPLPVQENFNVGGILFTGYDGNSYIFSSSIEGEIDGIPGTSNMPGRLVFSTASTGTGSLLERMRITSLGNVGIGTTAPNEALTVVGNISANSFYGGFVGNADTATRWETPRNITLSGSVYGIAQIDGTQDITVATTLSTGVIIDNNISDNANISDIKLAPITSDRKVAPTAIDYTGSEPGQVLMSTGTATIWEFLSSTEFLITDGYITTEKLANDIITEEKLRDGSVSSAKLSAGAVTQSKIANDAIITANILDGSVTLEKTNATPFPTPNTLMSRDLNGNLSAVEITAFLNGNAKTATSFASPMVITLTGDLVGGVTFLGNESAVLTATCIKPQPPTPVWAVYAADILDNLNVSYIQGSSTTQSNLITAIQSISSEQVKSDFGNFTQTGNIIQVLITSVNIGDEFTYLTNNLLTNTPLTATNIIGDIVGPGTYTPIPTGIYIIDSIVPEFSSTTITISTTITQNATGTIFLDYNEIQFTTPHNLDIGHTVNVAFLTSIPLNETIPVTQISGLYIVVDVPDTQTFVLSSEHTTNQSASGDLVLYRCSLRDSYGISNITYVDTGKHILNFTNFFDSPFYYGYTGSATSPELNTLFTTSIERDMSLDKQTFRCLGIRTILNNGSLSLYDFNRTHVLCFGTPLSEDLDTPPIF